MNIKFPYIEFLGLAEERIFRPLIPVTFKAGKESFEAYALVDSGSDYTILPISVAGILKLKLSDQPQYYIQGAGGNKFKIYKSPIEVGGTIQKRGFRSLKWESYIYFSEGDDSTLLLGQKGFFEHFEVRLDGPNREIEITA